MYRPPLHEFGKHVRSAPLSALIQTIVARIFRISVMSHVDGTQFSSFVVASFYVRHTTVERFYGYREFR